MPFSFGDIGKEAGDLAGGAAGLCTPPATKFQFDNKFSIGSKRDGVTYTLNAKCGPAKGPAETAFDLKAVKDINGVGVEMMLTNKGKIDLEATLADLAPGFKAVVSGTVPDTASGKLAMTYAMKSATLKGSIPLVPKPKLSANIAYKAGATAVGASAAFDSSKGCISAYDFAAQYKGSDYTIALLTADKLSTFKGSFIKKLNQEVSVGGELAKKMPAGKPATTSFALAGEYKLDGGASSKCALTSGGELSLLYTQVLKPKTVGTISCKFDTKDLSKPAKYGLECKVKP